MLEKKRLVDKEVVSAHLILCISSGLSTAELLPGAFRLLFAGKTGSEAVFRCLAKRIQRCAVVPAGWVCLVSARFQPGKNRDHGGGLGQLPVGSAKRAKQANPNQGKQARPFFQQASANSCTSACFRSRCPTRLRDFLPNLSSAAYATAYAASRPFFFAFPLHLRTSSS